MGGVDKLTEARLMKRDCILKFSDECGIAQGSGHSTT